jgi:uncharacterized protein
MNTAATMTMENIMALENTVRKGSDEIHWTPCPIKADWILEGAPVARIEQLSTSADGTASTFYWDCSPGRFNWYYAFDETLHILEGSVLLKDASGNTRRVGAGDIIYFPKGSHAEWTVERHVRKLAFCRTTLPGFLVTARNAARRLKSLVRPGSAAGGMLGPG